MRVQVSYVVEVNDLFRKSLMKFFGKTGLATWEDVERYLVLYGTAKKDNIKGKLKIRKAPGTHSVRPAKRAKTVA